MNLRTAKANKVVARQVGINGGAQFSFVDFKRGTLSPGIVFVVIGNTGSGPIASTFGNLVDGSIFTANGNKFQVSTKTATANELTLTVVP